MSLSLSHILTLLLCWLAYAVLHSLLASLWLKRAVAARWPRLAPGYRLAFNVLAVVVGGAVGQGIMRSPGLVAGGAGTASAIIAAV